LPARLRQSGACAIAWLATAAEDGFANLTPMGRLLHDADEDEWTIRFITDRRSRKAADMRRTRRVAIICWHDPNDAFVTLIGKATLCESESKVRKRWNEDTFVPSADRQMPFSSMSTWSARSFGFAGSPWSRLDCVRRYPSGTPGAAGAFSDDGNHSGPYESARKEKTGYS